MRASNISVESDAPSDTLYDPYAASGTKVSGNSQLTSSPQELTFLQRVFSFPVMLASLLVGSVLSVTRAFHVDPDLWWHIKVGESVLATHRWPATDIYSFTVSGQPWLAYEWLGDVLLASAYRLANLRGLDLLLAFLGSSVVIAIYTLATMYTKNSKAGFVAAALLSAFAITSFSLRPQMLGYLFLLITMIALERFREGKQELLWILPVLMLLWVNTHGSWVIGLGAVFVYWLSGLFSFQLGGLESKPWTKKERWQIEGVFLLSLLALPLTPYGSRVAISPFEFAFSLPLNISSIEEWQSMPFNMAIGKAFLAFLFLLIVAQVTLGLRWRVEELLLLLFGTMMACLHVRFLLVFVPFATLFLARILARWVPAYDRRKDRYLLNGTIMLTVLAGVIHFFPSGGELRNRVAASFPVEAVSYLQEHSIPGPMFNNYGFGGYLVWARGPEYKVFIDGRADVYERGGILSDYLHISRLRPGALAVLRNYNIQSCLLQRDEPLSTVLSASAGWERVYTDQTSALFVRAQP